MICLNFEVLSYVMYALELACWQTHGHRYYRKVTLQFLRKIIKFIWNLRHQSSKLLASNVNSITFSILSLNFHEPMVWDRRKNKINKRIKMKQCEKLETMILVIYSHYVYGNMQSEKKFHLVYLFFFSFS